MQSVVLNEEYVMTYPEGFHVMDEEERGKLNLLVEDGEWIGLFDPERAILVSLGWKKAPGLALKLLSNKDLAKDMEKRIRKPMQSLGYVKEGFAEKNIAGEKAWGFSYTYKTQGPDMYAQSYVFKHEKTIYYFHFYSQDILKYENVKVWDKMLENTETV